MVVGGLFVYMIIRLGVNWEWNLVRGWGPPCLGGHHCLLDRGHLFDGEHHLGRV